MSMLPQPPPDAPAPPPSEAAILSQRKWKWLWGVGVVSIIIIALVGLTAPLIARTRSRKICVQTEAVNNARQIGLALYEFEEEYGSLPNALTAEVVRQNTNTDLKLGTDSSNDFFRQLLASGIAQSEAMFHAKGEGVRNPDNVFIGGKALEKRECGFTYFLGATSKDNPARPLVVTPMIPGTDRFDPKPHDGKVVMLKLDNSVTTFPIDKGGHVMMAGKNLMDPTNLIWDGHPPVIAWPDL